MEKALSVPAGKRKSCFCLYLSFKKKSVDLGLRFPKGEKTTPSEFNLN